MKIPKNMKGGKMPNMHMDVNQMSRMIPPHMLQMMGGAQTEPACACWLSFMLPVLASG